MVGGNGIAERQQTACVLNIGDAGFLYREVLEERRFADIRRVVVPLADIPAGSVESSPPLVGYLLIAVAWTFLVVDLWTALASPSFVTVPGSSAD